MGIDGSSVLNPQRYTDNNCHQCWRCKKREGEKAFRWRNTVAHPFRYYALPVCCIDGGKAMYEVYDELCPEFEAISTDEQREAAKRDG